MAAREGRQDEARAGMLRAIATAQGAGNRGIAAIYLGTQAICEALAGQPAAARTAWARQGAFS